MLQLLGNEELPYADDASASIARTRGIPKSKKFIPEESLNLLETYKPEIKEKRIDDKYAKNIDTAKSMTTGLLTGFAGLPSDVLEGVNFVNDYLAEKGSPKALLFKDAINEAREKYGRDAFDKKFTEITGIKSDASNIDQVVGEILSPAGAFVATAKGTIKVTQGVSKLYDFLKDAFKTQTDLLTKGDGGIGGSGALVDGTTISKANTTKQMQNLTDKGDTSVGAAIDAAKGTKTVDKDNTTAPIIPESEFINAKPTINKLFAGEGTETGKKQAAIFRELEAQNKYTPEELFLKTRVYRGDDGQLRWEISTADAKLKSSWEKSLNFKKDNFNFEDEFLGITVPEKADGFYDSRASMQLSQILDFPTAYKEYYNVKGVKKYFDDPQTKTREVLSETQRSPLRNLQVYWERGDKYSNTLGYYTPAQDIITLNVRQLKAAARQTAEDYGISFEEAFKLQVQSTLLHEVQHAVQIREGFRVGGDSDNFLPKDYDIFVSTNKQKKDRIFLDIEDQFDVAIAEIAKKDSSYNALAVRNKILNEVETDFNTLYDVLVHTKTNSIDKYKNKSIEELNSISKEAEERLNNKFSTFKDYIYSEDIDRMKLGLSKNAQENIKLINIDTAATNKYYNLYGEREARLVQKRLEDRFKLNKLGGAEVAKEVESDTKFLSPEGDTDIRGRKLGQIGGFPANTKITPTKLMSDGTTFSNTIKKLESANVKPDNPVLQKISNITKLQDGPLGSRTKLDKDGLPENLLRDKKGKPLILYYGDKGYEFKRGVDKKEVIKTPLNEPAKLKNKFRGANFLTYGDSSGLPTNATYVTSNPMFASAYAMGSDRGSVIPIYVIADKVTDIGNKNFMTIDRAGAKADRGEVIIGNAGQDYNFQKEISQEMANAADKKYGTQQYVFKDGVQVFSALTGERLTDLPTINQNIRNKLLKLNQAEEDTLLKKMSPKEQLQYKAKKSYIEDIDDEYFIEDMFKLDRKGDIARNEKKRNLAKGGVTMDNQMEMFQDGGLKDEGGTIDPVSGNDVPSGSTQEEVRDDIPAQLSEGEFVFPADVVRFIGLEKLMMMRQEAKAGLKRMEEMGQMGNSDEATIPDDTPFDINDLDMEDDDTVEMAQGGVIQAANGTFVNTAPNVTYNPSQFATGQNLPSQQNNPNTQPVSYNVPVYNPVPAGSYTPTYYNQLNQGNENIATFENLVGNNYGQYDEMREYRSESGLILKIPFKGGQPIYPIPEGYTYVDPEETKTEEVKVEAPKPRTTQVTQEDNNDNDRQKEDKENMDNFGVTNPTVISLGGNIIQSGRNKGRVEKSMEFSINKTMPEGVIPGTMAIASSVKDSIVNLITGEYDEKANFTLTPKGHPDVKISVTGKELNDIIQIPVDPRDKTKGKKPSITNFKVQNFLKNRVALEIEAVENSKKYADRGTFGLTSAEDVAQQGREQDARSAGPTGQAADIAAQQSYQQQMQDDGGGDYSGYDTGDGGAPDAYDDPMMNKGGLLGKRKVKPKKMKRGGLASRK